MVRPPLLSIPSATPHDLRRTVRTHLGETLGLPPHISEMCLNHSLGKLVRTYDRGSFVDERRAAMVRWGDLVGRLVRGESAKVVQIHAAR